MGTWGTKLYQDDLALDIKEDYIEKLKQGLSNEEALEELLKENSEIIEDYDEGPVFWLVLADIMWRTGRLTKEVKEKALQSMEQNLKIWKEDKKQYEARKSELNQLKEKMNSPMPKEKKIQKQRDYKCEWKIGDTFAYKIKDTKDNGFIDQYFIIRKVGEDTWYPNHIIPVVYVQITKDKKLPKNEEEINQLEYIPITHYRKDFKEPKTEYVLKLINTSKRIIPKDLIYLGNFTNIKKPNDEAKLNRERYTIWACPWKNLETLLIEKYNDINLYKDENE